ncbi:MAG: cupin domain-containing protein [Candidatus Omnitrophica bacterium]|nr:cupin domain-containing protein [Candidatus Omnitrophota bacterium]
MPNIFEHIPEDLAAEDFLALIATTDLKLERIVSQGHATPPGEWLDQEREEWVILLKGSAGLLIEGEPQPRTLKPGDYLHLPARQRHRVEWTLADTETVWLALHFVAG